MEKVRVLLRKKIKGDSSYIATLVSIFMLLIITVGMLYTYSEVISRNEVERVHRKYLLAMERDGYLTSGNRTNLENDLASMGCSNIVISGSLVPVGYGNSITLRIECDLEVNQITITSVAQRERRVSHVVIEKSGTALY